MIIRKEQEKAFADAARQNFVRQMMTSLRTAVPRRCDQLSDEELRLFVERSINHAEDFGVSTERDIATFIMLHMLMTDDVHSSEAPSWSTSPYQDFTKSSSERLNIILDTVLPPEG